MISWAHVEATMNNRVTTVLLIVFFGGLLAYWWAERARVPTIAETQRLTGRVLPQLIDTDPRSIVRVEVEGGEKPLTLRRREDGAWQMIEPLDVPAASAQVESLITNLKALRRIGDAATLEGPPEIYGLDHPERTIKVFEKGVDKPKAVLELGKTSQDRRYVRAAGQKGAEVVDAAGVAMVGSPSEGWRERMVFRVASFDVEAIDVRGKNERLRVRREGGRWRLTEPLQAPADAMKIDGLLADLVNLQVVRDQRGFVADGVTDFKPYGLDPPELTIEITPAASKGPSQRLSVGREPEGQPGRVFARRGEEREVVVLSARSLLALDQGAPSLRSPKAADFDPARINRLRLTDGATVHELVREGEAWKIVRPTVAPADTRVVQTLIAETAELQAMQFLNAESVSESGLEKPWATLELWEKGDQADESKVLDLKLGRQDHAARAIFASAVGDPRVLAVPEAFGAALPRGELAFRERSIITLGQGRIDKVERVWEGKRVVLEANGPPPDFLRWRMTAPVQAPADPETTARLVILLGGMRAEGLVEATAADLAKYGLEDPYMTVSWSSRGVPARPNTVPGGPASGKVLIGTKGGPQGTSRYAKLEGAPMVFTLEARALAIFEAETHNRRVLTFTPEQAHRIDLERQDGTVTWTRPASPPGVAAKWAPPEGVNATPSAADQINALVTFLGRLITNKFEQYDGPIGPAGGLVEPRLTIRVHLDGESAPRTLRIGSRGPASDTRFATTAEGPNGPVFVLPETPFLPWLGPVSLPEDPFERDPP